MYPILDSPFDPSSFLALNKGPEIDASRMLDPNLSNRLTLWSPNLNPEVITSKPPLNSAAGPLVVIEIIPPVASPKEAGTPPVITFTSWSADLGKLEEPRTFTPSM